LITQNYSAQTRAHSKFDGRLLPTHTQRQAAGRRNSSSTNGIRRKTPRTAAHWSKFAGDAGSGRPKVRH